jgi:hypothetical protein
MSDACAAYSFRSDSTADILLAVLLLSVPASLVALCVRDPLTQLQIACNALLSVAAYFAVVKLIPMSVTRRSSRFAQRAAGWRRRVRWLILVRCCVVVSSFF